MRTLWNSTNYNNDLKLTRHDALLLGVGDCTQDKLDLVLSKRYVKRQVKHLEPENLRKELYNYGAWDSEQLSDHTENINRWLWLSAGDILENNPN